MLRPPPKTTTNPVLAAKKLLAASQSTGLIGESSMNGNRVVCLLASALLLGTVFAGLGSANSSPYHAILWAGSTMGLGEGDAVQAWVQVYNGTTPEDAIEVTFGWSGISSTTTYHAGEPTGQAGQYTTNFTIGAAD